MKPDMKSTILSHLGNIRVSLLETIHALEDGGDRMQIIENLHDASFNLKEVGGLLLGDYLYHLLDEEIFSPNDERQLKAIDEVGILFWMLSKHPNLFKEFKICNQPH
jgi:hypothetical protein